MADSAVYVIFNQIIRLFQISQVNVSLHPVATGITGLRHVGYADISPVLEAFFGHVCSGLWNMHLNWGFSTVCDTCLLIGCLPSALRVAYSQHFARLW